MPSSRPSSDLILHRLSSSDYEIKLKAIREVKNQIIGNRTKKLSYIKLGAVPAVADSLAKANADSDFGSNLIVQSAAVLGSFACGVDQGVRAVLDAGAFPNLIRLLSAVDEKEVRERGFQAVPSSSYLYNPGYGSVIPYLITPENVGDPVVPNRVEGLWSRNHRPYPRVPLGLETDDGFTLYPAEISLLYRLP
ncbi:armadillo repeat-containing protein 8-like [Trifolium pratense]|uniref:Armadillo repeat-containing protein 8-like n=2 Tax=Trifolium TaxID=3898 RepID=A0A2K3NUY3_TRIPR|nr:armadillo repeat-containing protein 8-like [Trifolium pratense]